MFTLAAGESSLVSRLPRPPSPSHPIHYTRPLLSSLSPMAIAQSQKRKLSREDSEEYVDYQPSCKQLKLSTMMPITNEVAMNDVQNLVNYVPFPTFSTRSSSLSIDTAFSSPNYTLSSLQYPSTPSSCYPSFELYPEVETPMDVDMDASSDSPLHSHHQHSPSTASTDSHLGLMQPSTGTTALQHGGNCTQIPRLRLSSHAGLNGCRTLWSHCESCGAIEMVKA